MFGAIDAMTTERMAIAEKESLRPKGQASGGKPERLATGRIPLPIKKDHGLQP
jgi:hypothetical protein